MTELTNTALQAHVCFSLISVSDCAWSTQVPDTLLTSYKFLVKADVMSYWYLKQNGLIFLFISLGVLFHLSITADESNYGLSLSTQLTTTMGTFNCFFLIDKPVSSPNTLGSPC